MRPTNQEYDPRATGPDPHRAATSDPVDGIVFDAPTANDTTRLGEQLGRAVQPGDLILLRGPIGAGKTTFTQGLARGMELDVRVTSPSFTLANVYTAPRSSPSLFHLDLWRLRSATEALGIGLDEYLDLDNVCVIEWPEIAEDVLPEQFLRVRFEVLGEARRIELCPIGARPTALLDRVRALTGRDVANSGGRCASGD